MSQPDKTVADPACAGAAEPADHTEVLGVVPAAPADPTALLPQGEGAGAAPPAETIDAPRPAAPSDRTRVGDSSAVVAPAPALAAGAPAVPGYEIEGELGRG